MNRRRHVVLFFSFAFVWLVALVAVSLLFSRSLERANSVGAVSSGLLYGVVFVALQSLLEEVVFRGAYFYIKRLSSFESRRFKILYIVISSLLFSVFHIFNSEVQNNTFVFVLLLDYFLIGALFSYVDIRLGSLAPSYGIHFINNIYTFFVVTSKNSSSPFKSLYRLTIAEDDVLFVLTSLVIESSITIGLTEFIKRKTSKDKVC